MYQTAVIALIAFLLAYVLALAILRNRNRKTTKIKRSHAVSLDKKFIQNKWSEIEATFGLGGPSHFKSAILEADKLVDYVLKKEGVKGETMGERMKNARSKFEGYTDYDNLWFAHKVRNNIAHESEHDLGSAEAKKAMEYYEQALKSLGALPW
jgi:hypothetical protein